MDGVRGRVAPVHQVAGPAMVDQGPQAAYGGSHHGDPARGSLQGDQTERLGTTRHQHDVGRPVPVGETVVRLRVHELDAVGEAVGLGDPEDALRLGLPGGPAGTTDHDETCIGATQLGQRANGYVDTL